jgi:hypothetical protein
MITGILSFIPTLFCMLTDYLNENTTRGVGIVSAVFKLLHGDFIMALLKGLRGLKFLLKIILLYF